MNEIVTCEVVFRGHPDKVCDQISDAILDACLEQDESSRVAVECAIKDSKVWIFGELTTSAKINPASIARRVLDDIGYTEPFEIRVDLSIQSPDIAQGVNVTKEHEQGAGDQGMMYGYATDETFERLPAPLVYARMIANKILNDRQSGLVKFLMPDGKCQVSMEYENGVPKEVKTIVVSTQTTEYVDNDELYAYVRECVLEPIFGNISKIKVFINPTGKFVVGGPYGDAGLTGRKIIVDTYGGVAHHGGGAFSGKDPSKVDRSAAYFCRFVANNIIESKMAKRCEVGVAYSIGVAEPVSITVNTFGTSASLTDEELAKYVAEVFDFRPAAIKNILELTKTKYEPLAYAGHFGRNLKVAWELNEIS